MSSISDRLGRFARAAAAGRSPFETRRLLKLADSTLRNSGLAVARAELKDAVSPSGRDGTHRPLADHVAVVSRTLRPPSTCLRQALVIEAMLATSGTDGQARIGVKRDSMSGAWESHAWVEVDGKPIVERADVVASYRTLALTDAGVRS